MCQHPCIIAQIGVKNSGWPAAVSPKTCHDHLDRMNLSAHRIADNAQSWENTGVGENQSDISFISSPPYCMDDAHIAPMWSIAKN